MNPTKEPAGCAIMISFNPLWRHQIESLPCHCPFVRETTCQSGYSSQRDSNADLSCFCCQSEQTLDWPVFRDAMAVIWRRRNVLNWIVSMVVAGGPTPIWHQDILKRHGEIGQLYIYRYATLFQSCPVVSAALQKTATLFSARELRNLRNYVFCKGVRWL